MKTNSQEFKFAQQPSVAKPLDQLNVAAPVFSWDGVANMKGFTLENKVTVDYSANLKSSPVPAQLKTTSESFVPQAAPPAKPAKPVEVRVVVEVPKKTEEQLRVEKRIASLCAEANLAELTKLYTSMTGKDSEEPVVTESSLKTFLALVKPSA